MLNLPRLRQINTVSDRKKFSQQYTTCSGLPVPDSYLFAETSLVFGFFVNGQLTGGFILGNGRELRTVTLFAQPKNQAGVYHKMGQDKHYTEVCCLWMSHAYRKNTRVNILNWISLAWAIKKYALPNVLFGTCSSGLARLYNTCKKAELIARDRVNDRSTYIFRGEKRNAVKAFANIIMGKLKRQFRPHIQRTKSILKSTPMMENVVGDHPNLTPPITYLP